MVSSNISSEDGYAAIRGKETRNCVVLAISFYTAYTAFSALQNLESTLNKADELGVISLSVLYASGAVSGIFAPSIINLLGIKTTILVSWTCHLLFTLSNFYPSFYTLIPGSCLLGGMATVLWTCQSTYISVCAYSKTKDSDKELSTVISGLFGMFYAICQTAQIPGNLISSLVLTQGSGNISSSGTMCGPQFCPAPFSANHTSIAEPDQDVVYILLGVFLFFNLITLLVSWLCLAPIPRSAWMKEASFKHTLLSYFKTLFTTRLVFLAPLILYLMLSNSFLFGDFTRAWVSCTSGIQRVGFVMASYGASNCLSALIFSRLARILSRYFLIGFAVTVHCALFIVMYIWTPSEADATLMFVIAIVWAIPDGILLTQVISLIGIFFPNNNESAFACFQTWTQVGGSVMYAVSGYLCEETKLLIVLSSLGVGALLYMGVEIYHVANTREKTLEYEPIASSN